MIQNLDIAHRHTFLRVIREQKNSLQCSLQNSKKLLKSSQILAGSLHSRQSEIQIKFSRIFEKYVQKIKIQSQLVTQISKKIQNIRKQNKECLQCLQHQLALIRQQKRCISSEQNKQKQIQHNKELYAQQIAKIQLEVSVIKQQLAILSATFNSIEKQNKIGQTRLNQLKQLFDQYNLGNAKIMQENRTIKNKIILQNTKYQDYQQALVLYTEKIKCRNNQCKTLESTLQKYDRKFKDYNQILERLSEKVQYQRVICHKNIIQLEDQSQIRQNKQNQCKKMQSLIILCKTKSKSIVRQNQQLQHKIQCKQLLYDDLKMLKLKLDTLVSHYNTHQQQD